MGNSGEGGGGAGGGVGVAGVDYIPQHALGAALGVSENVVLPGRHLLACAREGWWLIQALILTGTQPSAYHRRAIGEGMGLQSPNL